MKLKNSIKIFFSVIFVSLCIFLKEDVQALTQEEAGQYFAQFAINFFDNYADQTVYSLRGADRTAAYNGNTTNGKYAMDCVGWVSFVIHQSTNLNGNETNTGGDDNIYIYAQPGHRGSQRAGYFKGFSQIYGSMNSGHKLSLDELRNVLKPGDILLAARSHVLLYVGNGEIIHCTGSGPGASYGGNRGYGLIREKLEDYSPGFESVGRITLEGAASINPSNATTIFNGTGNITSSWIDGVGSVSSVEATDASRIVNPDDKLPLYKHILLTEKYNFNAIKWEKYGHGYSGQSCEMTQDLNLGLKYPIDQNSTSIDEFIDFTFPYLQSWLVPLAMHSGLVNNSNYETTGKSANFAYSVIKDAMSDITVNRYDLNTCALKTRYQEYDVLTYQRTVKIYEYGPEDDRKIGTTVLEDWHVENTEHVNTRLDSSGNVNPMLEEEVSKNITTVQEYHLKEALTFDVKISNVFNYIQYSDEEVNNRVEGGVGFIGADISTGEAINSARYDENYNNGETGTFTETYKVNVGNFMYVTRTWQDSLEQTGDTAVSDYTYDDVKSYNNIYGDMELANISTDTLEAKINDKFSGASNIEEIRWLFPYAIAAAKQTNSKILPSVLVAQAIQEGGFTNIAAAKQKLENPSATSLTMDRNKSLFNQKSISGYTGDYPSIETTGTVIQIEAYANRIATDNSSPAFENAREIATTQINSTNENEYKERAASVLKELGAIFLEDTESSKQIYSDVVSNIIQTYGLYKLDMLYDEIKNDSSIRINSLGSTDEDNSNEFTDSDDNYYNFLVATDQKINRVDIVNSKPSNFTKYINTTEKYSEHVGFSRAYLTFSYAELKKLFKEYFESGTLPFYWGASLGYETYSEINSLTSNTFISGTTSTNFGDLTGTGIELGSAVDSQSYENSIRYFDIVNKYAEKFGLDPYLVVAIIAHESAGNPSAYGAAIGLMQYERTNGNSITAIYKDGTSETIDFTFDELRSSVDLQIKVGCAALKNRINDYNGNTLVALQAYNLGVGGIKRTICHYLTNGGTRTSNTSDKYFGVSNDEYNAYIETCDNGWMASLQWYKTTGHKAFSGAGGGDPNYLKNVLKYYNAAAASQVTNNGNDNSDENVIDNTSGGYDAVFIDNSKREYKIYRQHFEPWASVKYWGGTIKSHGCGPTSLAIIASGYSNSKTPEDIANYIDKKNGQTDRNSLSNALTNLLNINNTVYEADAKKPNELIEIIKNNLNNKRPCVISVGKSKFTSSGHIMTVLDIRNDGNEVYIGNPNKGRGAGTYGWLNISDLNGVLRYVITIDE